MDQLTESESESGDDVAEDELQAMLDQVAFDGDENDMKETVSLIRSAPTEQGSVESTSGLTAHAGRYDVSADSLLIDTAVTAQMEPAERSAVSLLVERYSSFEWEQQQAAAHVNSSLTAREDREGREIEHSKAPRNDLLTAGSASPGDDPRPVEEASDEWRPSHSSTPASAAAQARTQAEPATIGLHDGDDHAEAVKGDVGSSSRETVDPLQHLQHLHDHNYHNHQWGRSTGYSNEFLNESAKSQDVSLTSSSRHINSLDMDSGSGFAAESTLSASRAQVLLRAQSRKIASLERLLEESAARWEAENQHLAAQLDIIQDRASSAEDGLHQTAAELHAQRLAVQQARDEARQAANKARDLEHDNNLLQAERVAHEDTIRSLEAQLSRRTQANAAENRTQREKTEQEQTQLLEHIRRLNAELEEKSRTIEDLQQRLQQLEEAKEASMSRAQQSLDHAVGEQEAKLAALREQHGRDLQKARQAMESLGNDLIQTMLIAARKLLSLQRKKRRARHRRGKSSNATST